MSDFSYPAKAILNIQDTRACALKHFAFNRAFDDILWITVVAENVIDVHYFLIKFTRTFHQRTVNQGRDQIYLMGLGDEGIPIGVKTCEYM